MKEGQFCLCRPRLDTDPVWGGGENLNFGGKIGNSSFGPDSTLSRDANFSIMSKLISMKENAGVISFAKNESMSPF